MAEMAVLTQELIALQARSAVRSDSDVVLIAKCQKVEKERDDIRTMYKDVEKQLGSVRRQLLAPEARSHTFQSDKFIRQSDHAAMLKKREEELLADMKAQ